MSTRDPKLLSARNPCASGPTVLYAWTRGAPSLDLPEDVAFEVAGMDSGREWLVLQVGRFSSGTLSFVGDFLIIADKGSLRVRALRPGRGRQHLRDHLVHEDPEAQVSWGLIDGNLRIVAEEGELNAYVQTSLGQGDSGEAASESSIPVCSCPWPCGTSSC